MKLSTTALWAAALFITQISALAAGTNTPRGVDIQHSTQDINVNHGDVPVLKRSPAREVSSTKWVERFSKLDSGYDSYAKPVGSPLFKLGPGYLTRRGQSAIRRRAPAGDTNLVNLLRQERARQRIAKKTKQSNPSHLVKLLQEERDRNGRQPSSPTYPANLVKLVEEERNRANPSQQSEIVEMMRKERETQLAKKTKQTAKKTKQTVKKQRPATVRRPTRGNGGARTRGRGPRA